MPLTVFSQLTLIIKYKIDKIIFEYNLIGVMQNINWYKKNQCHLKKLKFFFCIYNIEIQN